MRNRVTAVLDRPASAQGRHAGVGDALGRRLEITRLAWNRWAQREPVHHAALGLPALRREFAEVIDDSLFISNPERKQFHFLTDRTDDTWGISRGQVALRPQALREVVIDADRAILADRVQCEPVESGPVFHGAVLVVEDNGVHRQVIDQMLKGLGCRPICPLVRWKDCRRWASMTICPTPYAAASCLPC